MKQAKTTGGAAVLHQENARAGALTQALDAMKGALDALGTNVFVADLDLTLVYMNRRASDLMRKMGPTVEKLFGVSHRELIGTKIDSFHGSRAREIRSSGTLSNAASPPGKR